MEYQEKECSKCKEIKPIQDFHWRKDSNRYRNDCKQCHRLSGKKWQENNPEYTKEQARRFRTNNPITANAICQKYRDTHRMERRAAYAIWAKDNPEKSKERHDKSNRNRRLNPKAHLSDTISHSIWLSLKHGKDGHHWEALVNFTLKDLKAHLENQFKEDMNWSNHGVWHIDHVIPISWWQFNDYNDREFKQCWSLCNLQPLWAVDNLSKGNRSCNNNKSNKINLQLQFA